MFLLLRTRVPELGQFQLEGGAYIFVEESQGVISSMVGRTMERVLTTNQRMTRRKITKKIVSFVKSTGKKNCYK